MWHGRGFPLLALTLLSAACARFGYELLDPPSSGGANGGVGGSTAPRGGASGSTAQAGTGAGAGDPAGGEAGAESKGGASSGGSSGGEGGEGGGGPPDGALIVTTGVDEDDAGATPESPGGTGLSLREAIAISNQTAGTQIIAFEPGIVVALEFFLTALSDPVEILGSNAAVDGSALGGNSDCLLIESTVRLDGLEIYGCPGSPISINAGSGSQITGCNLHDNADPVRSTGSSDNVFGPGNEVSLSATDGLDLNSPGDSVIDNFLHDNPGASIRVGSLVSGARIAGNLVVGGMTSIDVAANSAEVWHNTLVGSQIGVLLTAANDVDLRNNVMASIVGYGIAATVGSFSAQDYNLFHDNFLGPCLGCTPGPNSVQENPDFLDAASGDYRLQPGSPAINAGVDVGRTFSGSAPDLGYYEAP